MGTILRHTISTLKQSGIYHRLRSSPLYELYLGLKDGELARAIDREANFYRNILAGFQANDLIFDIGAHIGNKVDTFLKIGARVIAVEPDKNNQAILRQRFQQRRLKPRPVIIVCKAAGATIGVEKMLVCAPGSVFNTLSSKGAELLGNADNLNPLQTGPFRYVETRPVEITTLDQLIDEYGMPALIKIDVVGFELEVMRGLHRCVPCLSFEIGLPEFRQELLACIGILSGLSPDGRFNYTWDRRNGLTLDGWVDAQEFLHILDSCRCGPLEVFWISSR